MGPANSHNLSMDVIDVSFTQNSLGTRVDAMIGLDVLGQSPFTIDYESRELVFGPVDPSFVTAPYAPGLPYAIVVLQVQQEKLEILVDTGASALVLFQSGLRNCRAATITVGRETWTSLGGEMPMAGRLRLLTFYLGAVSWGQRSAYVPDNSANQPSGLGGLLGVVALSKRVAFDPVRKVVAWDPK